MCQMARSPFQSGLLRSLPLYFKMALEAHHLYRERLPNSPKLPKSIKDGETSQGHTGPMTCCSADSRAFIL